ncbi:MAG: EamA family transporter, partial [Candidatus Heimdallarchaeota archaeon]|nr:EamA family transporter [Candidatus Heimdallarchaeota archaeon]
QNSSPIFWAVAINVFLALALFPIMLYKSQKSIRQISTRYKILIPIGLSSALASIFQMTAINLTLVAYVISIERTSAIISVLFGYFIFKEKGIKERLIGAAIMIIGVLLITLS